MNIGIIMDGGIVQNVIADEKANVVIVDYDTEDASEEEELVTVHGNEAYGLDYTDNVEISPEEVKEVFEAVGAKIEPKRDLHKDLQFLVELQKELNTQDRDSQAHPRFWVLRDYKKEPVAEGFHDSYEIYYPSVAEAFDLEKDMESKAEENGIDFDNLPDDTEGMHPKVEELVEAIESYQGYRGDADLYVDWVKEYEDEDVYLVPVAEKSFLVPNTFFITKEEAKRHIEQNDYHYSSKVHTYAMTAWRSPKVEKLFDILYNIDWEKLNSLSNE